MLDKAKESIKKEIEGIEDVLVLDKIQIFLMGMRAQKNLNDDLKNGNDGGSKKTA